MSRLFRRAELRFALLFAAGCAPEGLEPGTEPAHITPSVQARADATGTTEALVAIARPFGRTPRDIAPWKVALAAEKSRIITCAGLAPSDILHAWPALSMMHVRLSPGTLEALSRCQGVAAINDNLPIYPLLGGDDAGEPIGEYTGAGFSVAILDTGIDYTHSDFGTCADTGDFDTEDCAVLYGEDFTDEDSDPDDCDTDNFHGSNVSAIAAGVSGVAIDAGIVNLKVFGNTDCSGTSADAASALDWLVDDDDGDGRANHEAYHIVAFNMSLSFGSTQYDEDCDDVSLSGITDAIATAREAGMLPVAAAGNDGEHEAISYPACLSDVVAVANVYDADVGSKSWCADEDCDETLCTDSSTEADQINCSSNGGELIDVAAPGSIITAGGSSIGGTSQAAPHVTGAVALLIEKNERATPDELQEALITSDDAVEDNRSGTTYIYPRLNAIDALEAIGGERQTPTLPEDPLTEAELTFTPVGWSQGVMPVWLLLNGHPLPETTTRYTDEEIQSIEVTPYLYTLSHATVSMWQNQDRHFYVTDVDITDSDEDGSLTLETTEGRGDDGEWSHGGETRGDTPAISWSPESAARIVRLELELYNLTSPRELWLLANGTPVFIPPTRWDPSDVTTVQVDVTGLVERAAENRITILADGGLDGWVREVSMTDAFGTVDYTAAASGSYDHDDWSHFGYTSTRPDLPFATFVDLSVTDAITVTFTASDFDGLYSGALVVNGGWVRLEDQLYADGESVEVDVTGFVTDPREALVSWWRMDELPFSVGGLGDDAFIVEDLTLSDEASGGEWRYSFESLSADSEDAVYIGDEADGGLPGRTWFCEDCTPTCSAEAVNTLGEEDGETSVRINQMSFTTTGNGTTNGSISKPDGEVFVMVALVESDDPNGEDDLGWWLSWEEQESRFDVTITRQWGDAGHNPVRALLPVRVR